MTATDTTSTERVKTSLPPQYRGDGQSRGPLATFLGLFSIGLGVAEMLTPRQVQKVSGVHQTGLLRFYGVREVMAGAGILTSDSPGGWLWSRVAGDVLDLVTLAAAYTEGNAKDRARALQSIAAVGGVTVLDVLCATAYTRESR